MLKKIILFFFLLTMASAHARAPGNKFYLSVAGKGGLGKASSEEESFYKSRDLYVYGGEVTLGYVLGFVMLGGSAEYNIWSQKTEPKEVGQTNLSGKQITYAPTIGFGMRNFMFQVKPLLFSSMTLDKKSDSGDEINFSKPANAFGAQLLYALGRSYVGLEYSTMKYKEIDVGSYNGSLDEKYRVNFSAVRVVYGFKF